MSDAGGSRAEAAARARAARAPAHAEEGALRDAASRGDLVALQDALRSFDGACALIESDGAGLTALHLAAKRGHLPVCELLVELTALQLSDKNHAGRTPVDAHAESEAHSGQATQLAPPNWPRLAETSHALPRA